MSSYLLEIITPERQFFRGQVESVVCRTPEGEMAIWKGHQPMVAVIEVDEMEIKTDGEWKKLFISDGFLEVRPDEVLIFAQSCEWPDEIDVARAERAKNRALEQMKTEQSLTEQRINKISLARAMTRLKVKLK